VCVVDGVVVSKPAWQLGRHGGGVGFLGEAGIVALDGLHERFGHAVGLRAFDGRGHRLESKITSEAAGFEGGLAGAVVGQPFDLLRRPADATEAAFDGLYHQIPDHFAGDASDGRHMAHHGAIAAVHDEGDPHPGAVVAGDLKSVRAPAYVGLCSGHTAVMATLRSQKRIGAGMALQQKPMRLHHAIDALVVEADCSCAGIALNANSRGRPQSSHGFTGASGPRLVRTLPGTLFERHVAGSSGAIDRMIREPAGARLTARWLLTISQPFAGATIPT